MSVVFYQRSRYDVLASVSVQTMGNHHSHGSSDKHLEDPAGALTTTLSHTGSRKEKALSRTASGTDIQDKSSTQLMPVEKLAKILVRRTQEEDHILGITRGAFSRYMFPRYPALADRLFTYFHASSKAKTAHLGCTAFRQQCERFLGIMDDETILNLYVRMYSQCNDGNSTMTHDTLRLLLMTSYRVAMDHYAEGPQMCLHIQRTLTAIIDSCFHGKERLSSQYVTHWLQANCPRLLLPLHRYTVHLLATAYRALEADGIPAAQGLDLATPVLEQPPPFPTKSGNQQTHLLPMSQAWLLAGALPPVYSRPRSSPVSPTPAAGGGATCLPAGLSGTAFFLAKLISAVPSHWVMLYNSDIHGQGANRFLYHVLSYRGPTLILLKADNGDVFCVASTNEWHETHLYWGADDSAVLQLSPKFMMIETGPKMLYLNTTIRGYPQGLRAGKDPRKPVIIVDKGFEKIEYRTIPYTLTNIEVWGCGDPTQRETQLDIKKWQVKEAERQRDVKLSAADWLDHPDRYLLELAGRTHYSSNTEQNASGCVSRTQH